MQAAVGRVAVGWLIEKKRYFRGQGISFARGCGDGDDRTVEHEGGFPQHQSVRRALQPHDGKSPLGSCFDSRFELAGCLSETPFHQASTNKYTDASPHRT